MCDNDPTHPRVEPIQKEVSAALIPPQLTASSDSLPPSTEEHVRAAEPQVTDEHSIRDALHKPGSTTPQKLILEVRQFPTEKIAVELHTAPQPQSSQSLWKRFRDNIKDIGPFITGIASAVIAGLVLYYGYQFNDRQAKTQAGQAETAKAELRLKVLTQFSSSIAELNSQDERTKTLAAIRIAQYGEEALPPIKLALGVEQSNIRRGAAEVIYEMFQGNTIEHEKLFAFLQEYIRSKNQYLRRGVLECFVRMEQDLDKEEGERAVKIIVDNIDPAARCSKDEDNQILTQAAVFFGNWPHPNSKDFLLKVASNRDCKVAQVQAIDMLPGVAKSLSREERMLIMIGLKNLEKDSANDGLKENVAGAIEAIQGM